MEIFYFSATLSKERKSVFDGNVVLYSLNESFENGVMWKLTTSLTESLDEEGYVEKIEYDQIAQFKVKDAISAIYRNFFEVQNVAQFCPINKFPVFTWKDVALTSYSSAWYRCR